jgi:hypothetical protein
MNDLVPADRPTAPPARQYQDDLVDATVLGLSYHAGDGYSYRRRPSDDPPVPSNSLLELLAQAEWWRPQVGPPVRVREMTDTHRLHTARYVLGRATYLLGMPAETVKATPLFVSLLTTAPALPLPGEPGWDDMLKRAGHWSTCPRNRDLGAPACSPECRPKTEAWDSRPAPQRELWVDYNGDAAGMEGP